MFRPTNPLSILRYVFNKRCFGKGIRRVVKPFIHCGAGARRATHAKSTVKYEKRIRYYDFRKRAIFKRCCLPAVLYIFFVLHTATFFAADASPTLVNFTESGTDELNDLAFHPSTTVRVEMDDHVFNSHMQRVNDVDASLEDAPADTRTSTHFLFEIYASC